MKEIRYFYVPDAANQTELPAEESNHALRVLRLREGDEIVLMDGIGGYFRAEITMAVPHHCMYRIAEYLPQPHQWKGKIQLAIAPTKMNDRMEWMAEKATEIGIDSLEFLTCQFSERHTLKVDRIQKIVVAAVKQSHKAYMPKVSGIVSFQQFISTHPLGHRYIAHCYEEIPRVQLFDQLCSLEVYEDAMVLIGPEGDFSI